MTQETDDTIKLDAFLANIAGEIERLEGLARHLDDAVGALADGGASTGGPLVELQKVDALRQALSAVAQITATAADTIEPETNILFSKRQLGKDINLERVREACLRTCDARANGYPRASSQHLPVFFEEF